MTKNLIISHASKRGFCELYWQELRSLRKENATATREDAFDSLSAQYAEVLGAPIFPSFDAFRMYSKRHRE